MAKLIDWNAVTKHWDIDLKRLAIEHPQRMRELYKNYLRAFPDRGIPAQPPDIGPDVPGGGAV